MPLPDSDKAALRAVAENQALLDAFKRLFYSELLRAKMDGLQAVDSAFQQIAQYKSTSTTDTITINPAR